jgi:hypothetical protein
MDKPIITITDQQVSRRSKVPLKTLREYPDFLEKFRAFMTLDAKGTADNKRGEKLLKEARTTKDPANLAEAGELFKAAADAALECRKLYGALIFPGKTSPVLPSKPAA